ncbi:hypothetical protein LTR78_006340 [Recurvomyces mirabilis]|uniref:Ca2+-modulated nonselective cation channel polycystin n=1 Tax=Recurvomyces mirabilis TaxID=574656 RepID=A0AAE0WL81_9PEZI|nr:hypothetical protein LTR78_006340 [Recurvomyces mirabilis]KAK5152228.1 hypothetical protein LTS14_008604 [Recurvomyces mirabilis]
MAAAEVAPRPAQAKRKPFASWVKRITNLKGSNDDESSRKKLSSKHKKSNIATNNINNNFKNNPCPESGALKQRNESPAGSANGQLSFATPTSRPQEDAESYGSIPHNALEDRDGSNSNNKSGAPTLATNPETVHSDAGYSKAATTNGGALSSAGAGSTFSSPAPSERSLTTTLTTIQSQAPSHALNATSRHHGSHLHGGLNNPNQVMFSHQYPTSPAPTPGLTASAIPRHVSEAVPNTYNSATANNLLTDNASILTLASSSKRRRRSMDTDASVRAIPPSSVWGGSRESLPLSVLSGNMDPSISGQAGGGMYSTRPSVGGLASAERASIYSSQGVSAPALASERNSYYSKPPGKDMTDGKSLRSITNLDARSQYDARSINADARSQLGDVASLKGYEGSVRSGLLGHSRNDSVPGSIGSPLASPGLRQTSGGGALSRRSSEWHGMQEKEDEDIDDEDSGAHHAGMSKD